MPLANRDLSPEGRRRNLPGQQPPAQQPPPPATGQPLKKATAGAPMKPGPTPQQLARRARNNGTPMPSRPTPGAPTPGQPPGAGASKPSTGGKQGTPNTATDPLPPQFADLVKRGRLSPEQARKNWARSLGLLKGPKAGAPTPAPSTPTTTPPPAPGAPAGPAPGTPVGAPGSGPIPPFGGGGGAPGGPIGGPVGPFAGPGSPLVQPGTSGGMTDFRDPMMTFFSAVPMMNMNTVKQIDSAMAGFGDGGNRWSSTALGKAGELGAQNAMQQNALLTGLLRDYSEGQENRALQATGQGMQLGGMYDQMAQDRVRLPSELGQWEQGRQDQFQKDRYKDFEANKLGWFPYAFDFARGQGAGSPGQIYSVQQPGEPGAAPWLELLAGLLK